MRASLCAARQVAPISNSLGTGGEAVFKPCMESGSSQRGAVARIRSARDGLHRGQIERAWIVLDESADADCVFRGPLLPIGRQSEIPQGAWNVHECQQLRDFVDQPA